ncbi:uncharacterized protein LOC125224772 [Leguminivora glycinivorella]|uniref:uncharacterized protein LOC125224772 n=1 Tax=Leguminivora glycinivorella TaxID=1035111 RepID=UPI00200C4B25|nr:uncharacterized protein LOC125224772 [Leguminivora glycinivorella]
MPIDGELYNDLILFNNNFTAAQNLAISAAKVALNNFEWRYVTMVYHNTSILLGLTAFMQIYRKSVVVGKGTFLHGEETSADRIRQFVLFGTDLVDLTNILDWMRLREFDNTGKFIVICHNCDKRQAIGIFWNHKILNVVLINDSSGTSSIGGFTYSVYDDENCLISPPEPLQNSCIHNSCKVYPLKLRNFHKCQLIVSTFEQVPFMSLKTGIPKGADGDLLLIIAESLNATLKVMTPHRGAGWGQLDKDGNWLGSLADVYYDLANLSMTSAAITLSRFKAFHMSTDYRSINMAWVTHPAIPLPGWQKLLRPFQLKARITLAVTFLLIILVGAFVKSSLWEKLSKRFTSARPQTCVLFYSWTIFMGMPATSIPSKPVFLTIFLLWIFYCFMIRTFYQTSLIHAMKDNSNYPEFENLEDILNSGYPLGGVPALKDYYLDNPEVYNSWKPINSTEINNTMVSLSKGMKYVLAMNKVTAQSFILKHYGEVHIVSQIIATSPTVLFFKKFSPMAESLNLVLARLVEAGFTEKLYKNHASVHAVKKGDSAAAMNIEQYMGCYVVLAAGWIVSLLVFICEVYCYKCRLSLQHIC